MGKSKIEGYPQLNSEIEASLETTTYVSKPKMFRLKYEEVWYAYLIS